MLKFITYGDESFYFSKKIIALEAKKLNIFDEIILFNKEDLSNEILLSPLMKFKKGGGYWLWKPFIIYKSLLEAEDNDIIVYADSGCSLFTSTQWGEYFSKLNHSSILLFQYNNFKLYSWTKYNENLTESVNLGCWMKKRTIEYFNSYFKSNEDWFLSFNIMLGGVVFCKKDENSLLFFKKFLELMLTRHDLVVDPQGEEKNNQFSFFYEHRHDQALLTPLAHYYEKKCKITIMNEEFERPFTIKNPAILTSRRRIGKKNKIKAIMALFYSLYHSKFSKQFIQLKF